jgi:hypothetical protein
MDHIWLVEIEHRKQSPQGDLLESAKIAFPNKVSQLAGRRKFRMQLVRNNAFD